MILPARTRIYDSKFSDPTPDRRDLYMRRHTAPTCVVLHRLPDREMKKSISRSGRRCRTTHEGAGVAPCIQIPSVSSWVCEFWVIDARTGWVVYSLSLDNFKNIKFHQSINSPNFRISCVNFWYNGTFSFKCGFIVASQSITVILDFFSQITHFCPSIPRFYLKSMNLPFLPRSKSWPKRVIGKLPLN